MNTTQRMTDTTLKRVKEHGKMGDSFDDALNRILDKIEKEEMKND